MYRYKAKDENGVTLISLTVTVILLLMLSTITISIIGNNDGIFLKTDETIEKSRTENDKKAINEAIAEIYIRNGGIIEFIDLGDSIKASNGKEYKVDTLTFTIGGFTLEELDVDTIIDPSVKYYMLGNQSLNKYIVWRSINENTKYLIYYNNQTIIQSYRVSYDSTLKMYTDGNGTKFEILGINLVVHDSDGDMIFMPNKVRSLSNGDTYVKTSLSGRMYTNEEQTAGFAFDENTVMIALDQNQKTGYYAAVEKDYSNSDKIVYVYIPGNNGEYEYLLLNEFYNPKRLSRSITYNGVNYNEGKGSLFKNN